MRKTRKKHAKRKNADEKVANKALPRHKKLTRREKSLKTRQKDYDGMMASSKAPMGAYHRPGSMNK